MSKKEQVQQLQKSQADAERLLWRHLRNRNLNGLKFRRQHTVGPYILDFYCHELKIAIELDGEQHADPDKERSAFVESQNIRVLRFGNNDVFENIEAVLESIISKTLGSS